MAWVQNFTDNLPAFAGPTGIVLETGFFFLTGSLVFIAAIFVSRMIKSHYRRREHSLRFRYQKILNKIVVNETCSEVGLPNAAFEYYMAELRLVLGGSNFSRQLLLTQIMEFKKSLTGNSASALVKTYYDLLLFKESFRKVKNRKWQKKALGIRELAEMEYRKSIPSIVRFLYTRNQTLREESIMALVRLEEKPLSFLNHYKGDLSPWMRINVHRYLRNLDYRNLPSFSKHFNHSNLSVRLFSISMARHFRQSSSLHDLAELLYSDNPKVVGLAIAALGELEAYQYRQTIADLSKHVWRFEKLAIRVLKCLGNIGDKQADLEVVGEFLSHPCYSVRFQAVAALKKFGSAGEAFLQTFNREDHDKPIDGILRHFSEPLLI